MAKMHQVQLDENNQKVINQISLPEGAEVVPSDAKALAPGEASAGIDDKYARGDHRHPAQVISKGDITKGGDGDITVTTVGLETKINVNFPDAGEVYAAHSTSEEESEELKELMPDGGIIIEREPDAKPVLKQIVGGQLVATELSGGIQATYTADSDETDSIIDEVEEGALIVEGTGPIVVETDARVSSEAGNAIVKKEDGLFVEKPDDEIVTFGLEFTAEVKSHKTYAYKLGRLCIISSYIEFHASENNQNIVGTIPSGFRPYGPRWEVDADFIQMETDNSYKSSNLSIKSSTGEFSLGVNQPVGLRRLFVFNTVYICE